MKFAIRAADLPFSNPAWVRRSVQPCTKSSWQSAANVFFYAGDNLDHSNWDPRSLFGEVRLDDKTKIMALAFELGLKLMNRIFTQRGTECYGVRYLITPLQVGVCTIFCSFRNALVFKIPIVIPPQEN